jgi:hypothetical protein
MKIGLRVKTGMEKNRSESDENARFLTSGKRITAI